MAARIFLAMTSVLMGAMRRRGDWHLSRRGPTKDVALHQQPRVSSPLLWQVPFEQLLDRHSENVSQAEPLAFWAVHCLVSDVQSLSKSQDSPNFLLPVVPLP
jgi:hypothetical protein